MIGESAKRSSLARDGCINETKACAKHHSFPPLLDQEAIDEKYAPRRFISVGRRLNLAAAKVFGPKGGINE
ncbi:hypothetical protein [Thioclava sp.]|uniref:hypothetical protein n=1 Tax=Thioclava sp. TaxID=1933450 RepID=UPI003AA9CC54